MNAEETILYNGRNSLENRNTDFVKNSLENRRNNLLDENIIDKIKKSSITRIYKAKKIVYKICNSLKTKNVTPTQIPRH